MRSLFRSPCPVVKIFPLSEGIGMFSIPFWKKTHTLKNIYVLLNGQQTLPLPGDSASYQYGYKFSGAKISGYRKYFFCDDGINLASYISQKHSKNSLVVSVQDTLSDWGMRPLEFSNSVDYLFSILDIMVGKDSWDDVNIILVGFSRGALVSFYLAELLYQQRGVVPHKAYLIDPVASSRDLYFDRYIVDGEERLKVPWNVKFRPERWYPVLKFPVDAEVYNVFQRKSFFNFRPGFPVGCGVSNAKSLKTFTGLLCDQNDTSINDHFYIRDFYVEKLKDIL